MSKSEGTGGWLPPENILSRHFEKYLHDMDLKLTEHVRNTISLLYKQKQVKFRYLQFFSEKFNFGLHFVENRHFHVGHVFITCLWLHTLTDFHDFGINGKRRPYPILWYQTTILWACQFQYHREVVTTPLGRRVTKKKKKKEDDG